MRVRHTETRARYSEPSVNFYRTIAFSFLALTIILLGVVVFFTSKKATVTIMAKEDTKSVNLSVAVNSKDSNNGLNITGAVTSTVVNFSQKYFPTGSKTIEGPIGGEVMLYNTTAEAQTLVKTTRLLSDNGILFRLSDKVTVPANGQIKAEVYADKNDASSNIGPSSFTVPGLSLDKQKLIYAKSEAAMQGQVKKIGILTEEDINAASKDFSEKLKAQYMASGDEQNIKRVVSVLNSYPISDKKAGEEVDGFTLSGTSTVVIVSYDQNNLNSVLSSVVTSKVDNTLEKALTVTNEPKVSVASIDAASGSAVLSVSQDVLVTIDANAPKLSVDNFMDKKKDEIERYIFELDHVAGVQVDFSPSWISKAPNVADKIKIIVKDVK